MEYLNELAANDLDDPDVVAMEAEPCSSAT